MSNNGLDSIDVDGPVEVGVVTTIITQHLDALTGT